MKKNHASPRPHANYRQWCTSPSTRRCRTGFPGNGLRCLIVLGMTQGDLLPTTFILAMYLTTCPRSANQIRAGQLRRAGHREGGRPAMRPRRLARVSRTPPLPVLPHSLAGKLALAGRSARPEAPARLRAGPHALRLLCLVIQKHW